jgi:Domain of unknown function (DUF4386)
MYRSGLVPRGMAMLRLIGGPLIIASGIAVLFDVFEPGSGPQAIATIPEFLWELSLGIYLMVKGFRPSPMTAGLASPAPPATAGVTSPTQALTNSPTCDRESSCQDLAQASVCDRAPAMAERRGVGLHAGTHP